MHPVADSIISAVLALIVVDGFRSPSRGRTVINASMAAVALVLNVCRARGWL